MRDFHFCLQVYLTTFSKNNPWILVEVSAKLGQHQIISRILIFPMMYFADGP